MKKIQGFIFAIAFALTAGFASAGTNGTEFATAATAIQGWLEGGLGQLLALGSLAIGLGMGVVKQSIMAVAVGVAMALACSFGPGIVFNLFGAGLQIL